MSYKNTLGNVAQLILDEYEMAKNDHGKKFRSMHEGYAVLLEEIEEAKDELDLIMNDVHLKYMWNAVKHDDEEAATDAAHIIRTRAACLACEAVQVAAMATKFLVSFADGGEEDGDEKFTD